jgi:putative transposase
MPRIARVIAPSYPHHITQRGNNREDVFFDRGDREKYLELLIHFSRKHAVLIWAYCLMTNHVHLLAVPHDDIGLARGIGLTNLLYTQYLNGKSRRSGRIWQNRFFSCITGHDQYLWNVARYIETNPVRAGMVQHPEDYPWSSARAHLHGTADPVLSGTFLQGCEHADYADFLRQTAAVGLDDAIRRATCTGRPYACNDTVMCLEKDLDRPLRTNRPGRPKRGKD